MGRFDGKTVLVTGAGSGIGWEMARLFREDGAAVFGADLDPSTIPDACEAITADVSSQAAVEAMVAAVIDATGRIDVLCNNAGIGSTKDPVECSLEEWEHVFSVNARGVFLGTKLALPHMLRAGSGSIVNTASVAGLLGLRNRAAYCASKGAVIAFTKAVAIEYADIPIRCNCICPGTIDSPWIGRLLDETDDPDVARADLVARQPIGRLGEPVEAARAAVYLASDDAAFVTGSAFVIDGGIMAGI